MAKAVEDSASPKPTIVAAGQSKPGQQVRQPGEQDAGDHDLRQPEPENLRAAGLHSREGLISSPMMNSRKTMPSSATCRICFAAGDQPRRRADGDAGGEIAEDGAEPDALEQRRGDHRAAEQQQDFGIDRAVPPLPCHLPVLKGL